MATIGSVAAIGREDGCWAHARSLGTGHRAVFYPDSDGAGAKRKRLYLVGPDGAELGYVAENVRDFAINLDPATGEIWLLYSPYNDNRAGWTWTRWNTGVRVALAAPPSPAPGGNAATIAALRDLLARAQELVETLL